MGPCTAQRKARSLGAPGTVTRYLLDAAFLIDYLRGNPDATDRMRRIFEEGDEPLVNEVVVGECWTGAHDDDDRDLVGLLRPLEFIQPGPEAARQAGRWRSDARNRGRTLDLPDALIAAAAEAAGAIVLTRNVRDFALTPVRVESY